MANSEEHNKEQHHEHQETEHQEGDTLSVVVDDMTILDLKDDIVRDNICSFLDRGSICKVIKQDTMFLSKHFQLCKDFCNSHGTRQSIVSQQERKEFKKRRKQQQTTPNTKNLLITHHPGCMDCVMGLDGQYRCGECNTFRDCNVDIGNCHKCNRTACHDCVSFVHCYRCRQDGEHVYYYCRDGDDCFDGFQCPECGGHYCHDCETSLVSCDYCEHVACSACASDHLREEDLIAWVQERFPGAL